MSDRDLYSTVVVRQATSPIRLGDELLGGSISAASVGDLQAENEALRAELEAIRGQEPVAWKVVGVNPKHRHPHIAIEFSANLAEGQAAHWRNRGCTTDVVPLYAMPTAKADEVSACRKLLGRLQERLDPHIDARDWGMICDLLASGKEG